MCEFLPSDSCTPMRDIEFECDTFIVRGGFSLGCSDSVGCVNLHVRSTNVTFEADSLWQVTHLTVEADNVNVSGTIAGLDIKLLAHEAITIGAGATVNVSGSSTIDQPDGLSRPGYHLGNDAIYPMSYGTSVGRRRRTQSDRDCCNGGGHIRLEAGSSAVVDGSLDASGEGNPSDEEADGGGGGSILLQAPALSGTGSLSVQGGLALDSCDGGDAGLMALHFLRTSAIFVNLLLNTEAGTEGCSPVRTTETIVVYDTVGEFQYMGCGSSCVSSTACAEQEVSIEDVVVLVPAQAYRGQFTVACPENMTGSILMECKSSGVLDAISADCWGGCDLS